MTTEEVVKAVLEFLHEAKAGEYYSFALEDGRFFQLRRKE